MLQLRVSGGATDNAHFLYKGIEPFRANLQQHPFGLMLSQERDGKEKGLWPENKRNWTQIIFTTRFSTTGGMGMTAIVVHKRLASLIAEMYEKRYSNTMQWIQCRLSYSLLRSAIMCLRGSRSSQHNPAHHKSLEIPLILPAQWAGFKTRTEHSTLYAVYIFLFSPLLNYQTHLLFDYILSFVSKKKKSSGMNQRD